MTQPPELPGVRHEYVDVDGLRTHVALAGPHDGPALVLVHGWPQNWWVWRAVIPALSEHFRVIAPDLRGHGWTEAPPDGYDKQQLASDLLALLDVLEIERVTWIGHDWGGWVGFLAALRASERFERMLALCIPHPWTPPSARQLAVALSYQAPISLPFLGPRIATPMVRALLKTHDHFGEPLIPDDRAVFADRIPNAVSVAMYRTFLTRELVPIAWGRYAREVLQVPTTAMVGERDPITHGATAGPVARQPQLHVEVLPAVAHWVPEQRPQDVIGWALNG
jgi:pimeloyl-ACP methyl ester carboxylesterase